MLVFASELLRRGYRVDLLTATFEGALKGIIPSGVRVVNFNTRRLSHGLFKLVGYLRADSPLALYSTITNANVIAALANRLAGVDTKVIVRQSNVPISEPKVNLKKRLTFGLLPIAYRWTDGIIAVSEGVAAELAAIDKRLASRIRVINTPVVSEEVLRQGEAPNHHPWFRAGEPPVVLAAGRLVTHKGFITLLEAFKQVRRNRVARLLIIGEGRDRALFEAKVRELQLEDDVSLPGFQTNPFAFMSRAAVFVLSSEYEGLPNVLIQAMAFGTPVVSTDCKSGPRQILEDGRLGKLVPVGDVDGLARGIEQALDLPRQEESKQLIFRRFGAASATDAYLQMAGLGESAPLIPIERQSL
jgi:glycosyltransferase involved in cell wall biosynthesis